MLSFFRLRSGLDIQGPLQKLHHLRWRHMERFAACRHVTVKTVMREFSLYERLAVINALRIFARRILHVFLFQIVKPQFPRLVRKSAIKSKRLVARKINGIAFRAKPQIKVYDFERLDFRTTKRTFTHALNIVNRTFSFEL